MCLKVGSEQRPRVNKVWQASVDLYVPGMWQIVPLGKAQGMAVVRSWAPGIAYWWNLQALSLLPDGQERRIKKKIKKGITRGTERTCCDRDDESKSEMQKKKRKRTSRFLTSSLTFAVVSEDCLPLDASLISVDRKFLHFFTFSSVSCRYTQTTFTIYHNIPIRLPV